MVLRDPAVPERRAGVPSFLKAVAIIATTVAAFLVLIDWVKK
jgi:hypothetical protein